VYYHPTGPSAKEVAAKHLIDRIYTASPFYGSRKITVELNKHFPLSRPTVSRYMREMGLCALYPGPKLSQPHPGHKIDPYLLRHLVLKRPNQVWGTDITYLPLNHGWMYLVAVLDWFSRYVVATVWRHHYSKPSKMGPNSN
jgi:putative transposase